MEASDKCKSCHAPIVWATTKRRKVPIPIDVEPRDDGNLVLVGEGPPFFARPPDLLLDRDEPKYVSHFASCPSASYHRRERWAP